MSDSIFYIYVLFDWCGVPFYVGKGHKSRWLEHEQRTDRSNQLKNEVIEQTWIMLGEIPKIKVREGLEIVEALAIETALIIAIGRRDLGRGPLVNLTDGGEGTRGFRHSAATRELMSVRAKEVAAARGPERRREIALRRESQRQRPPRKPRKPRPSQAKLTPEEISEIFRRVMLRRSPEERRERAKRASTAAALARSRMPPGEVHRLAVARYAAMSDEKKKAKANKTRLSRTTEQRREAAYKSWETRRTKKN